MSPNRPDAIAHVNAGVEHLPVDLNCIPKGAIPLTKIALPSGMSTSPVI
jgi:hypothetical protein